MKQLISKVRTKGNIWRFNTMLKAVLQITYVSPNIIIPYFILTNLIRKNNIYFKSFITINCQETVFIYKPE